MHRYFQIFNLRYLKGIGKINQKKKFFTKLKFELSITFGNDVMLIVDEKIITYNNQSFNSETRIELLLNLTDTLQMKM